MATNLILGVFALSVGIIAILSRVVVPTPERSATSPYKTADRRSIFPVLAYGLVPMLAGIAFLAAWWQEQDAMGRTAPTVIERRAPMAQVERPAPPPRRVRADSRPAGPELGPEPPPETRPQ